jgi:hypothetical protein
MVIAASSVAPAYSLAAALAGMVAAVGAKTPSLFIIGFVPMMLTALAFRELADQTPDCGTTFTWTTRAFGPWVGWLAGWASVIAAIVAVGNGAQIAAIYLLSALHLNAAANSMTAQIAVGGVAVVVLLVLCIRGNRRHRADPGRVAVGAVRHVGPCQHSRPGEGVQPSRRSPGGDARVELVGAIRAIRLGNRPRSHPLCLRLLGMGRVPVGIGGDQGSAPEPR